MDIVDTVGTAVIVRTADTLDIVKSVSSADNDSSAHSVHNVHDMVADRWNYCGEEYVPLPVWPVACTETNTLMLLHMNTLL